MTAFVIKPNGDISQTGATTTTGGGGAGAYYTEVNEGVDTPDGTKEIGIPQLGTVTLAMQDMPSDTGTVLTCVVRAILQTGTAKTIGIRPIIKDGSGTAITSSGTFANSTSSFTEIDWTLTVVTSTKAAWDAARLFWECDNVGSATYVTIDACQIEGTYTATASVPGAPTGLTAVAVSSSQINLTWITPASDGGSAITGYRIFRESPNGGGFSTLVSNTGSTSTSYSDTGLTPATQYGYTVEALNAIGASSASVGDFTTTASYSDAMFAAISSGIAACAVAAMPGSTGMSSY